MMERLQIAVLACFVIGGGLIVSGCKANFDPLPDDDTAADDDSSATDDDTTGDDDTGDDAIFVSAEVALMEGGIYAVFFSGNVDGSSPIEMLVLDNAIVPGTVDVPHVRFVHGHSTTYSSVDFYVTSSDIELYSEAGVEPGSSAPDPMTHGYGDLPLGGEFEVDAYPAGTVLPSEDTIQGPPLINIFVENDYYSVVLSGTPPQPRLILVEDEQSAPSAGNLKVGVFHSIEGVPQIDVRIERLSDGYTQSIATGLDLSTMGSMWGLPAETMIFRVYPTTPLE